MNTFKMKMKEKLSENLSLRDLAKNLFDYLNKLEQNEIMLDFAGIKSISNSFAQEYLEQKKISKKLIREENVPENIQKMFDVIASEPEKPQLIDIKKIKVTCLSL